MAGRVGYAGGISSTCSYHMIIFQPTSKFIIGAITSPDFNRVFSPKPCFYPITTHLPIPTSASRVRLRNQPQPPRQRIILSRILHRIQPLIQKPQPARLNRQRLIQMRTNHLPMANTLRPRRTPLKLHVRRPSKRMLLRRRGRLPPLYDLIRREAPKVALPRRPDRLDH